MFKLDSEADLLAAFRPKDRKSVELASEVKLPLFVRDYVAWTHPAGSWVFLVFAVPGGVPIGITFQSNDGPTGSVPQMCDWCHTSGQGSQVTLLTAQRNAKKRVGAHVCSDLSCKQKLEEQADRSGRSVLPAMQKLVEKMGRFAAEALDIDLTGKTR